MIEKFAILGGETVGKIPQVERRERFCLAGWKAL
jgi:hypothetical protein